jgi:hypothetical protein
MGLKQIVTASVLAMSFGLLSANAASAGTSEPAAAAAQARPAANDRSRRVCRNLVRSGSRFPTRYCHTQAEWDEAAEAARRNQEGSQQEISPRDGALSETRARSPNR